MSETIKKMKFEDIDLIVTINPLVGDSVESRAYTAWNPYKKPFIGIVLRNVTKDIENVDDIDEWTDAIITLHLIEFICGSSMTLEQALAMDTPCRGKDDCPIRILANKIGYKYKIKHKLEGMIA